MKTENLEKEGINFFGISIGIFLGLVVLFTVTVIYEGLTNFKLSNKIIYSDDCTMKVPSGYKLCLNKEDSTYIVQVNSYIGVRYLYTRDFLKINDTYPDICTPAIFQDSCHAKGYLKGYLTQRGFYSPKLNVTKYK